MIEKIASSANRASTTIGLGVKCAMRQMANFEH